MPTFTEWLTTQTGREDEIGDLACDLAPLLAGVDTCATPAEEVEAIGRLLVVHAPDIALDVVRGPLRRAHGEYVMTLAAQTARQAAIVMRRDIAASRHRVPSAW